MTVGTGVGHNEDRIHSLAHGLKESMKYIKPDEVVFFGSNLSKKTVKSLKTQYFEENREKFPKNEFILIENVDSFDICFSAIKNSLESYKNEEVIIDYTSGTKTMTMSIAICSILYHKDLILVTGTRGKNGLITSKTENIITQNPYKVYDELYFDEFKKLFNNFRYLAAQETLDKIVAREDKEVYIKLSQVYRAWDLFNHTRAKELLTSIDLKQDLKNKISENLAVLGPLSNLNQRSKCPQIVADLINNAKRRGTEQKYDDAVARLYRTVELIAQCILNEKYGINTSNVEINKLNSIAKDKMKFKKNTNNKITCGLQQSYNLLLCFDEKIGKKFNNDDKLKDLLKRRNHSILAHGLDSITEKDYNELLEKTIELAFEVYPGLDALMKKAEFPKL